MKWKTVKEKINEKSEIKWETLKSIFILLMER